jgi:thiosulfate/3-mercaptopyruvate sulfurtransferase
MDPVIAPEELAARLDNVVLFDCRSGNGARAEYARGHLPGAIHVDLETDLSLKGDAAHGGRHPLPPAEQFAKRLGEWGVGPDTHVVAYDDQGGANAAARLWWMLRALGHQRVQVLDGGLPAALVAGFTLTGEPVAPRPRGPYPARSWLGGLADVDEVDQARQASDQRVLDVRAAARFRGEHEPIDPIAGHIPGARNVPLTENLRDGRFKSGAELRALYTPLLAGLSPEALIVHCGSGVTACHTLLALERAGLPGARLYVGSWSEWCRQERPMEP